MSSLGWSEFACRRTSAPQPSPSSCSIELGRRRSEKQSQSTSPQFETRSIPTFFVRTRVTVGSVSPAEVDRMLEVARTNLAHRGAWLTAERARLARAASKLDAAVHAIVAA